MLAEEMEVVKGARLRNPGHDSMLEKPLVFPRDSLLLVGAIGGPTDSRCTGGGRFTRDGASQRRSKPADSLVSM